MSRQKDDPVRLICGMNQETANSYIVVRQEIGMIINRLHKAGDYLSEFEKIKPGGICRTLSLMGKSIMHDAALIREYLDNDFVSLERIEDALSELKQ